MELYTIKPQPPATADLNGYKTLLNQLNNVNADTALGQCWFH